MTTDSPIHISFECFRHIQQEYRTQYLPHPTAVALLSPYYQELHHIWDGIVHDTFHTILEKLLQCPACFETHKDENVKLELEDLRANMERVNVLDVVECTFDRWNKELDLVMKAFWLRITEGGGCPKKRPQPGTLVNGKLILGKWEREVYEEWMDSLHDTGWRKGGRPQNGCAVEATKQITEAVEKRVSVHNTSDHPDEATKSVVKTSLPTSRTIPSALNQSKEGTASRLLREMGMQHYEYKGKEIRNIKMR